MVRRLWRLEGLEVAQVAAKEGIGEVPLAAAAACDDGGCFEVFERAADGAAGKAGVDGFVAGPARCSTVVLNGAHAPIVAGDQKLLEVSIPAFEGERENAENIWAAFDLASGLR
jgi:hypothetical protein